MKEIIIQNTPVPIHFGLRAVNEFAKRQGADFGRTITAAEGIGSLESIVALTVTGLNEGARIRGLEDRYTEDDVWDIFDAEPQLILTISDIFIESITPLTDRLGDMSKNSVRPTKSRRKD